MNKSVRDFLVRRKVRDVAALRLAKSPLARTAIEEDIRRVDRLLILLLQQQQQSKEGISMNDVLIELGHNAVRLEALRMRPQSKELEALLKEAAGAIEAGQARPLTSNVPYGSLAVRISKMKKRGDLPKEIVALRRGQTVYLGRNEKRA